MTNSKQEYNDFVRANLPGSIRYDSVRNRYVTANNKYFVTYKEAKWYVDYLVKRGSNLAYAEGGYTPSTILDYSGQKSYVGGNLTSSFDDVVTATRTGLATQLDASGNLVWNAHNLLLRSQEFDNASWVKTSASVAADDVIAPDGTTTADTITSSGTSSVVRQDGSHNNAGTYTATVWLKPSTAVWVVLYSSDTGSNYSAVWVNLSSLTLGTVTSLGSYSGASATITEAAAGFVKIDLEFTKPTTVASRIALQFASADGSFVGVSGQSYTPWGAHLYRSDLGGMAPVPLTRRVAGSTTYVPTTSAAVYLPREEAYIYNANTAKWNAHNLITYSEDFTDASWTKQASATVVANTEIAPDGTLTADTLNLGSSTVSAVYQPDIPITGEQTFSVWAKCVSGTETFRFIIFNGTDGQVNGPDLTVTTEWQRFSFTYNPSEINNWYISNSSSGEEKSIFIWGAHLYRSDLNGVVANSGNSVSGLYVPTEGTAVQPTLADVSFAGPYYQKESDARTNLVTYSEDFTGSFGWGNFNSIDAKNAVGPDGEANSATTLADNSAGGIGNVWLQRNLTTAVDTAYTLSVLAKADQLSWLRLQVNNVTAAGGGPGAYFNLSNGTVGTVQAGIDLGANIEDFGNGWYRCSVSFTSNASVTSGIFYILPADADNDINVDLDGTSSILIYGAQLEAGSTPTSYIPTAGSTVTRSADSTTISAGNMPYPTPQVIGPELFGETSVTSADFWDANTGVVFSTTADFDANLDRLRSDTLTSGKVYSCSFTLTQTGSARLQIDNSGASGYFTSVTPTGTYEFVFVADGVSLRLLQSGTGTLSVSSLSVREINPLALSFQMEGLVTYADTDTPAGTGGDIGEVIFSSWRTDASNYITQVLSTVDSNTGVVLFQQRQPSSGYDVAFNTSLQYSPGINVPFNIASRHGSTFINGAVDGTALTADLTPRALPDLSATTFDLAPTFNGFIKEFRVWADDIGDTGIAEAST